jgi:hypothetical protein
MNIKKSLLVAGAVTTMTAAGMTGLGVASAATSESGTSGDGTSSLVDKLATKFNLNKDDVQAVFDEERTDRQAERQQKFEERLTQAVADGKITEDQKDKILVKMEELESQRKENLEKFKSMSEDERHEAMKSEMESLKTWADENDIPMEYLGVHMKVHGDGPGAAKAMNVSVEADGFGEKFDKN